MRRSNWVKDSNHEDVQHRDGVAWDQARRPWRFHVCRPQSRGTYGRWVDSYEWCRCGARRWIGVLSRGKWADKNSRLPEPPEMIT